jgi:hypothetical protein
MSSITTFHRNYRGGFVTWIQDYEDAFTELALLGQKTWNDDDIKKRLFVQNAQNIGLVDTVFEELVSDKSFIETCNFLRSNAIRLDQQYKMQDRFTILTSHPMQPRSTKLKRYKLQSMKFTFNNHAVQMKNQSQYHQLKLQ